MYRKSRDATSWGSAVATLGPAATNYTDANVMPGVGYEYRISKTDDAFGGEGYIYCGIQMPLVEARGTVVLIVDNTVASNLVMELQRLQNDLTGDGWTVIRHDVARTNSVASVKALILADYRADTNNVNSVFLFGHVPVPYAGDIYPDAHPDHEGAWPCDGYYGDTTGAWLDTTVSVTVAADHRNYNEPGDGKFDPDSPNGYYFPAVIQLRVGRVDLSNLPAFALPETELLRQYLNKDHNFRHRRITAQPRGLIDDNFGVGVGEAFAADGWRNFAAFFGASNSLTTSTWVTTLADQSFLWGYGCGPANYTLSEGVTSTAELATNDPQVVFVMLYGSYFGDWDAPNDLLRAPLATPTYTLTCAWAGRPHWQFHHMALGETTGFSARLAQNNDGTLYTTEYANFLHIALMGDPTLRMQPVAPPAALSLSTNHSGQIQLSWTASTDSVAYYAVYGSTGIGGPFTRLPNGLVTTNTYTDTVGGSSVYMVRAVKLQVSASGSYFNPSQGVFEDLQGDFGPPVLTLTVQSTNKVFGGPLPDFTVFYNGFANGDTPANLSSPPVVSASATAASPVGSYPIHVSGAASTNYFLQFVDGTLTILPAAATGLVASSTNPALPAQPVSLSLNLSAVAPGVGIPTGTAQFKMDGTNTSGPVSLSGGTASFTTAALAHGVHSVAAEYAGDGNFLGTTNSLSPPQVINTPPVAGVNIIERDPASGTKVSIAALLSNDLDADGDVLSFAGFSPTSANGGLVVSNAGWIFYSPALGFTNIDTFSHTITDGYALVPGQVTVNVRANNGPSPNLTISGAGKGPYMILGDGIPARTYQIQFTDSMEMTNWLTLGSALADPYGLFQFFDPSGAPQRFYR